MPDPQHDRLLRVPVADADLQREDVETLVELGVFPDADRRAGLDDSPAAVAVAHEIHQRLRCDLAGDYNFAGAFHRVHGCIVGAPWNWGNLPIGIESPANRMDSIGTSRGRKLMSNLFRVVLVLAVAFCIAGFAAAQDKPFVQVLASASRNVSVETWEANSRTITPSCPSPWS